MIKKKPMKTSKLITCAIIGLMAFYACKTKKEIVKSDKDTDIVSDSLKHKQDDVSANKMDINSLQIQKYMKDDTTMLCFNSKNINDIIKQLSYETTEELELSYDSDYIPRGELTRKISRAFGEEKVEEYLSIIEQNSTIKSKETLIEERTNEIIDKIDSGEVYCTHGIGGCYNLVAIEGISSIIQQIYSGFPLFYSTVHGYPKTKTISTVYEGKMIKALTALNIAYKKNMKTHPLSLEERLDVVFRLKEGLNADIKEIKISNAPTDGYKHYCTVSVNDRKRVFYALFVFDKITAISEKNEKQLRRYIFYII